MNLSLKQLLEALLFATNAPLSLKKLQHLVSEFCECETKQIKEELEVLALSYDQEGRAFELIQLAGGYIVQTRPDYASVLEKLYPSRPIKLSNSSLETLSIIAYKQPLPKAEIEEVRGVDCSYPLSQLLERGLINNQKKLDAPGQPSLYETTPAFLEYFGLKNLKELPQVSEEALINPTEA